MHPETIRTPFLIIGAGAAGLRVAIELSEQNIECLVIGKRSHGDAHTVLAAGGINAALGTLDPDDGWTVHAADTILEGHFVCDPLAVEILAREAPDRVRELEAWGCPFDTTADGRINQRFFGAQTYRRTCFVGDRTGRAILETLAERARQVEVPYRQDLFITRLLAPGGRVSGAAGFDVRTGRFVEIAAGAVVLAAGGFTALYGRSTSRAGENTGDAMALALEAGARLKDMDFVQFHPTGMVAPDEWKGKLVTEAMRGEGGRLFNAQGERFMERYAPERLELDARDVVARAIYQEIRQGRGTDQGAVLLDISHVDSDHVRTRLPRMYERFMDLGIDITRAPIEVAPTAHYGMGGIVVDFETGETGVPGLYAVGEAVAGLHGANRLGGNSLAETLVFGKLTGVALARRAMDGEEVDLAETDVDFQDLEVLARSEGAHRPGEVVAELGELLWHRAGIVRNGDDLEAGIEELAAIRANAADLHVGGGPGEPAFETACNLRFMLPVAEAILRSALHRGESRGAHYRADAPNEDPHWRRNIILCQTSDGYLHLDTSEVGKPSADVEDVLLNRPDTGYHHLE